MNGLTVTENQSLFFQAEDKDGNILATNSISIYKIGNLTADCFNVSFNFSKGTGTTSWVEVLPNLNLNQSSYYDIYYKIGIDNVLSLTSSTGHLVTEYNQINNNEKMVFNTISGAKFKLYFELRNKVDGNIGLTKSYNIDLKSANAVQSGISSNNENSGGSSITGGIINEGTENEEIMTPSNDKNIANSYDIDTDWELSSAIDNTKFFFSTAVDFINLILNFLSQFPSWIIVPLSTLFWLGIIIFVIHAIRG